MAKICVITDIFPHTEHKSAGIFVRDHAEILAEFHEVTVIVIRSRKSIVLHPRTYLKGNLPENVAIKEINYFSFPRNYAPNFIFPLLYKKLKNGLDLSSYDLFYVHNILPGGGLIPSIKKHYPNSICVQMVHNSDWRQKWPRTYLRKPLINIAKKADYVWVSGPAVQKEMQDAIPALSDKFKVVYNIVAPTLFNASQKQNREEARNRLSWKSDDVHILTVANIAHVKGIDVLINALAKLPQNEWDYVHILGGVREKKYATEINELLKKYKLSTKFIFHKAKTREELAYFYSAVNYYVLPSRYEGFNVSMIEAASFNLPSVITECDGSSLIIHDKNRLPAPGSVTELASSLKYMFLTKNAENSYNKHFLEQYCQPNSLLTRIKNVLE